eukprot:6199002-Pleurochrysis_carterae.AAC.5
MQKTLLVHYIKCRESDAGASHQTQKALLVHRGNGQSARWRFWIVPVLYVELRIFGSSVKVSSDTGGRIVPGRVGVRASYEKTIPTAAGPDVEVSCGLVHKQEATAQVRAAASA